MIDQQDVWSLSFEEAIDLYEDAINWPVEDVALLGRLDRFFLLGVLLNRPDVFDPWLYDRCREVEREPDGYLDLWAREHYKSTIITYAGVIQEILKNPEITIGVFSFNKPTARKFLRQIKYEFESNNTLKALYPDILWDDPQKQAPRWSEDSGIVVKRQGNPREATLEGHGLVDGQPTGAHFLLRVYDDVVTIDSVTSPEMVQKTTEAWSLSDNLGARGDDGLARAWHIGTRYCTVANTKILMADWTHKRIEDVRPGDVVVGWEAREGGKRFLRPATVKKTGMHPRQPVNTYRFENGRSVTCTPDHRWWRGAHGSGDEYKALAVPAGRNRRSDGVVAIGSPHRMPGRKSGLSFIRELLVPVEIDPGRDAGWLAGMFDGEGTTKKNTNHPSGVPCIVQTLFNPEIVEKVREVLTRLGFEWSESWVQQQGRDHMRHDRCVFAINGGWRERYRFLAKIAPTKIRDLAPTLFAQLQTRKHKLVAVENAGSQDVYWLETETGNYVADGFCSKNSFGDTYNAMMEMGAVKPRIYPATHDGTISGRPVFLPEHVWKDKLKKQTTSSIASQMLQNPAAGNQAIFQKGWLRFQDVRPATLNIYILCDPASSKKKGSDRTAIPVIGIDTAGNRWLVDGYHHRMGLSERWQRIRELRKVWMRMPGVQSVKVGYERYGSTSDLEYFEEMMERDRDSFEIVELAWPREGPGSKIDRVQRLEPWFRGARFFLPALVKEETKAQRMVREAGQAFRIYTPVQRRDEEGRIYSLNKNFLEEYLVFPFGVHDDLIDAMSRIEDIDPQAPILVDERTLEPEVFEDGI